MPDDVTPAEGGQGASGSANDSGTQLLDRFDGPEWLGSMPQELQESTSLRKFKTVDALANGYLNAERLIGREKIPVPKTDDEFLVAARRMGALENPADYGLSREMFPESVRVDGVDSDVEWFAQQAAELGLTKNQATKLLTGYGNRLAQSVANQADNWEYDQAVALQSLKKEWGADTDRQLAIARRAMSQLMTPQLQEKITNSPLGNDPDLIRLLAALGGERMEEMGLDTNGSPAHTPMDLKEAISKAQADPAYLDSTHPDHKRAVAKAQMLFEQLVNLS